LTTGAIYTIVDANNITVHFVSKPILPSQTTSQSGLLSPLTLENGMNAKQLHYY